MFGSSILDVLLGVVFTFLAVSLAASAVTEAVASLLKLRQATLLAGIKSLLNDPQFEGLARDLYNHALVNPLSSGAARTVGDLTHKPAYIDARHFAAALTELLQARSPGKPIAAAVAEIPDRQLRDGLQAMLARGDGDLAAFQAALAAWFDGAMARLSGWYKRQSQAIAFVAALGIAALLNADPLRVTALVWSRPILAQSLAGGMNGQPVPLDDVLARLDTTALIGWSGWSAAHGGVAGTLVPMVLGWIVAAAASLFGAPFWFDVLQRIAWIRGTGAPVDKGGGKAS